MTLETIQKTRTIHFRINVSKEQQAEYKRIVLARDQLNKDERALIELTLRHPDIRPARVLAGYSGKIEVKPETQSQSWLVSMTTNEIEQREKPRSIPSAPYEAPIHLDPRTINILLSGKLLTEVQKRELVNRIAPGLFEKQEPGA